MYVQFVVIPCKWMELNLTDSLPLVFKVVESHHSKTVESDGIRVRVVCHFLAKRYKRQRFQLYENIG